MGNTANDALSGEIIDLIGLTGHKSNGLGLAINHDTRDNQNPAASGSLFEFNNVDKTAYFSITWIDKALVLCVRIVSV